MVFAGTDGIEYESMCLLEAASCQQQRDIGVKRTGSCGESVNGQKYSAVKISLRHEFCTTS